MRIWEFLTRMVRLLENPRLNYVTCKFKIKELPNYLSLIMRDDGS